MALYQYDVVTTLNAGYDREKGTDWILWIDADDNLWYTVNGSNKLIDGKEREKTLKANGYPKAFDPSI